ncbi:MAG: tetratricopeptide repeat protein [Myxococcales bacterium]|nr:tetratricopeptide repeat protein [Myxococcales bacterium]
MTRRVSILACLLVAALAGCKQREQVADRFVSSVAAPNALRGLDRLRFELGEAERQLAKRPHSWFSLRRVARLHIVLARFTGDKATHCKKALDVCQRALRAKSPIPAHRRLEIYALSCLGQHARAKARYEALPAALKQGPRAARLRARLALAEGKLADVRTALAQAGQSATTKLLWAELGRREGKLDAAEKALRAIRSPRHRVRVARALARVLLQRGKHQGAIGQALRALEQEPGHVQTLLVLARAQKAVGNLARARGALQVARTFNPRLAVPPELVAMGKPPASQPAGSSAAAPK